MSASPSLDQHIRELEERLLQPEIRRSQAALAELLADDFVEFASDGAAYTKPQVIAALQGEAAGLRSLTDFHLLPLGDKFVLATYRSTRRDTMPGQVVESLRSSVWAHRGGGWQIVFHQGTPVAP